MSATESGPHPLQVQSNSRVTASVQVGSRRPGVGRVREVDAEFPIGKRQEEDPQRQPGKLYTHKGSFDVTKRTTVHRVQEGVYDYKGGKDGKQVP